MKAFAFCFSFSLFVHLGLTNDASNTPSVTLSVIQDEDKWYGKVINLSGKPIYYLYYASDYLPFTVEIFDGKNWKKAVWDPGPICGTGMGEENPSPAPTPTAPLPDHRYKQEELFDFDYWKTDGFKARVAMTFSWDSAFKDTFTIYSDTIPKK